MIWSYYLDTSVFGAMADAEDPVRVSATTDLFDLIEAETVTAFTSVVALEEIALAPASIRTLLRHPLNVIERPILDETDESRSFTEELLTHEILTARFRDDARHLAVAVTNGLDAVIS